MADAIHLTKTALNRISFPSKGRIEVYDDEIPGLAIRLTAAGSRSFVLVRRVGRAVRRLTLGRYPAMTPEQARKAANRALGEIASGRDPMAERTAIRRETTMDELFTSWRDTYAKAHLRSWKASVARFDRHLLDWKNRPLSSIDRTAVVQLHSRLGKGAGQYEANRVLALLSVLFAHALRCGWKSEKPTLGVRRFREKSRDRFLRADELPRFFASLISEPDPNTRDLILSLLLTGARRANVLGMHWNDLDLDRGVWRIPGEESKNSEVLTVALAVPLVVLLRERRKCIFGEWVFPSEGAASGHVEWPEARWRRVIARAELFGLADLIAKAEKRDPDIERTVALSRVAELRALAFGRHLAKGADPVKQVCEEYAVRARALKLDIASVSMGDLRMHDLRRSLGSWQAITGASLAIIGKSLGHKSPAATAVYARLSMDPVRQSVEAAVSAMAQHGGLMLFPTENKTEVPLVIQSGVGAKND